MIQSSNGFGDRNSTSEPPIVSSGTRTLFQFISLGLIIAIGSAGNSIVIYAFGRYLRVRRRTPHTFVVGFVSLDLVRVMFCFPIVFVTVVHPLQLRFGPELCQLMAFTNVFCLIGNSLNVCGMALDRYLDNKHRAAYRRRCRSSFGTAILLIVLSLAFTFSIPAVYNGPVKQFKVQAQCTFPHYYYAEDVESLTVPVSVTLTFLITNLIYIKLFLLLRGRRKMRPVMYEPAVSENWGFYDPRVGATVRNRWLADSLSDTPIAVVSRTMFQSHPLPTNYEIALWRSKKQKDNEKLTKLCFTVHIIFSVMWLPYVVTLFYLALDTRSKIGVPEWVEITVTWISYLQATITPVAFASFSGLTRRKIRVLNGKRFSPTLSSSST